MSDDVKKEALEKIAKLLSEIDDKYAEAQRIADEADVGFSIDGPAYGMGGYYSPLSERTNNRWRDSNEDGWSASSQSC